LGDRKYPVVIILNDNEMSIAKPIGAISRYLSTTMASPFYQKLKENTKQILEKLPDSASYMAKRFEESFRLITPGLLFEELGINYIGPIDGHDIELMVQTLEIAKNMGQPVIIHAQTTKGKGYEIAEGTKEHWHGVSAFDLATGESTKQTSGKIKKPTATEIFADKLLELAQADEKVVGVTAAMPTGTGMMKAMEVFPDRFWDVAIAEQHAVTSMGPLAKEGFKPFCTIYSTFLQRGFDQVVHDIALMDLGVTFAMDRAGIVGEDGETHQGVFDISYLRGIPNMTLMAPYNENSMKKCMEFLKEFNHPSAFRYPRGAFMADECEVPDYECGKSHLIRDGDDILFIGYGNGVGRAIETANLIDGVKIAILDLRFVKPLDEDMLLKLAAEYARWYVFSDSVKQGGVGSAILECLSDNGLMVNMRSFEYSDQFIAHGNTSLVEESLGILPEQLAEIVQKDIS